MPPIPRRPLLAALLAAPLVAPLATPTIARAQPRERVTIAWLPIMQTTAFYVAQQEGMFERAGLEIEAARFQAPNQIIDALVANRAEVGAPGAAAGITVLAEAQFPGTFKVFGLQGGGIAVDRINDGLIVANASPIRTFADLRGRTLGHLPGIQWRTISRHLVRKAGLDPDHDVRLVELAVGLQVQAVIAGTVDATLSLEPVGSIAEAVGEARRALVNPCAAAIADPFYSGVSVLTTKFLRERPAVARRVITVLDAATRLANAEFPRFRPMLPRWTPMQANQVALVAQPYLRAWDEIDAHDLASYAALIEVFRSEGVLRQPMDARALVLTPADLA